MNNNTLSSFRVQNQLRESVSFLSKLEEDAASGVARQAVARQALLIHHAWDRQASLSARALRSWSAANLPQDGAQHRRLPSAPRGRGIKPHRCRFSPKLMSQTNHPAPGEKRSWE